MPKLSLIQRRTIKKSIKADFEKLKGGLKLLERRKVKKSILASFDTLKTDVIADPVAENGADAFHSNLKEAIEASTEEFGIQKGTGKVTREKLNEEARDILKKHAAGIELTVGDIGTLKSYSGKGGLTEGSQYEYYTPTHVAAGMYDLLAENGSTNGNFLESSTGAGVFGGVKPEGVIITGAEIDKTSATINQILHPEDSIMNKSFEELVTSTDGIQFDAVIGNIPFGDQRGSYARKDPEYKSEKQIERYFIHRSIDKVRPGGLICLIVPPKVVSDKGKPWIKFRTDISKKAEFLGAHKLPSKTFGKQGTNTVTDIIVLKKHPEELAETVDDLTLDTLKESNVIWDEFVKGKYWLGEGKQFIKGKHIPKGAGRWDEEQVIADEDLTDKALQKKLAVKFDSRINWEMLDSAEVIIKNYVDGDTKYINGSQLEMKGGVWVKVATEENNTTIDFADYGAASLEELVDILSTAEGVMSLGFEKINKAVNDVGIDVLPGNFSEAYFFARRQNPELQEHALRGVIIGSRVSKLQSLANSDSNELGLLRNECSALVSAEFERRGHASKSNKGIKLVGDGAKDYGAFEAAVSKNGTLSDLLKGVLDTETATGFDPDNAASIVSHLYNSELEPVSLEDVAKYYTGTKAINDLADLAEIDELGIDPSGGIYPIDVYCSGEFVPKLGALNEALSEEKEPRLIEKYKKQLARIESSRIRTETAEITFGLRHKWIEPKYIEEFLQKTGYSGIVHENGSWGHPYDRKPSGIQLRLLRYLQGEKITGDSDYRATDYRDKINNIQDQFNNFLKTHADSVELTEAFNLTLNSYIPFEYSKAPLGLSGKSENIEPHPYQNQAIRQLSDKGRGILGDGVGLGKTLQSLALHQYDIEKGRGKRTCIVVPVSVLQNWYNEANNFLSDVSGALFVGFEPKLDRDGEILSEPVLDESGEPKINKYTNEVVTQHSLKKDSAAEIKRKLRSIPQSNYSLVIMPTTRFEEIPLREDTVDKYMSDWVSRGLANDTGKKGHAHDKKRERLRGEHSDVGKDKDDGLPYFEDMMFDKVIVDEGHLFKNSYKPGKEAARIANIPGTNPSKRAADMAMKLGHVRDANGGRGTYMLTATPFTNSPVEIFNMMAMTMPMDEFENMGIYSTDDFISVFGQTEIKPRVTMSGDIVESEMLTGFNNLQGLRGMFYRYAVVRDAEMVKEDMTVPPFDTIRAEVELSDEQEAAYELLRDEAQDEVNRMLSSDDAVDSEDFEVGADEPPKRHMFSILRDMERVAADMDLYSHIMTFIFKKGDKPKVEAIIAGLVPAKTIKEKNSEGEMEYLEVPLEYSLDIEKSALKLVVPEHYEDDVLKGMKSQKIGVETVTHPLTPKYAKLIANLKSELDAGGKQLIFTEEKTQHKKLQRIICHHLGLKAAQVGIINADEASGEKLQAIADLYNSGQQKIVIANKKAEVGVNLQKGTTAIHHLTFPWTPSSLEQRNGRGVRQGNTVAHINIYYYVSKRSVDTLRLDRISGKENWINKMVHGDTDSLEYKDENTLSNDDYLYLFSKNPEEAKARLKIEESKAMQKRQDKKDKNVLIAFSQMAEARFFIDNFDTAKAKKIESLHEEAIKNRSSISRLERQYGEGNKQVVELKITQQRINKRLASFDLRMDKMLETAENTFKQQQSYLSGQKTLPFDAALLDSPSQALTTNNGLLLEIGKTYEVKGSKDLIFRVESIDFGNKRLGAKVLLGKDQPFGYKEGINSEGIYDVAIYGIGDAKPVVYDDFELDVKAVENLDKIELSKVMKFSKRMMDEKHDLIVPKLGRVDWYFVLNPSGDYQAFQTENNDARLPEGYKLQGSDLLTNETAKRQIARSYLSEKREGYVWWRDVMPELFGRQWEGQITQYGDHGSQEEVLDVFNKEYLAASADKETLLEKIQTVADTSKYRSDATAKRGLATKICKENKWDNLNEAGKWCDDFVNSIYQKAKAEQDLVDAEEKVKKNAELEAQRLKNQAERLAREAEQLAEAEKLAESKAKQAEEAAALAKIEESKTEGFKEIPTDIRDKLAAVNIAIHYIGHAASYKAGRATNQLTPYSDILLHDNSSNPFNGVLYEQKENIKALGAKFTKDIGDDAFDGAWWIVSGSDPQAVIDALMPDDDALERIAEAKKSNTKAPAKLLIPESLGLDVGDKIEGKDWIVSRTGKSWSANANSLKMNESQAVTFDIDAGDTVHYAYFS